MTEISNKSALRDSIIVIAIACLLIGFGIGVTIYDHELTKMFSESSSQNLPIKWHDRYYQVNETNLTSKFSEYNLTVVPIP